jgi:hypothetical protein
VTISKSDKYRAANLRAALGFLRLRANARDLRLLHRWLDSWSGIGLVTVGMYRQGYRLSLSQIAEGEWRASFGTSAMFAPSGYGVAPTPWRAVQDAAWSVVKQPRKLTLSNNVTVVSRELVE